MRNSAKISNQPNCFEFVLATEISLDLVICTPSEPNDGTRSFEDYADHLDTQLSAAERQNLDKCKQACKFDPLQAVIGVEKGPTNFQINIITIKAVH